MKKINNEYIAAFDIDCTVIKPYSEASADEILKFPTVAIKDENFLELSHITDRIKRHHMQGHYVRIWSAGGSAWAETVIKALKLDKYVDEVGSKPRWYFDDKPADEWMQRTIP